MIFFTAIATYFIVTAFVILAVCVLSARMSEKEDWSETPIVESPAEAKTSREYQVDAATSP